MSDIKNKGVEIDLAGTKYIMPPLGIKAYKDHDAAKKIGKIEELRNNLTGEQSFAAISDKIIEVLDYVVELIYLALKRNYPDITEEEIEEGIPDIVTALFLIQYLVSQDEKIQKQMAEFVKNIQPQPTMKK